MKYLFFILIFSIIKPAFAQHYIPLVEEGKYWIYSHHDYSNCFLMGTRHYEVRFFEGDTIVSGESYKKLISAFSLRKNNQYEIFDRKTVCLMREDSTQKKVYMLNQDSVAFPCTGDQELVIWDFSLKTGDSVSLCTKNMFLPGELEGYSYCIVDSTVTNEWGTTIFTKGVHPGTCGDLALSTVWYTQGFGMPDGPVFRKFNILYQSYCEGSPSACNIISHTKDATWTDKHKIILSPNPSQDFISFFGDSQNAHSLQGYCIRDSYGKLVKGYTSIDKDQQNVINIDSYPSGMYFIQFFTEGYIVQTERFEKIF